MATVKLGYEPNVGELILSEGADWVCTFQESGGAAWPDPTTCRLEFPDLDGVGPFSAVVDEVSATAEFVLQETDTTADEIPDGTKFGIYLVKENDFLWFKGKVKRKDIL
jgi:hypothetical protein